MTNCVCGNQIPLERLELGYKFCVVCGDKIAAKNKKFGYVCYGHKTAGSIVVATKAAVDNYKKVSQRKGKRSNMAYASKLTTTI